MNHCLFIFVTLLCVTTTRTLYAEGSNRILNGSPATENQFPYMISLQRLSEVHSDTRGHKCGGVLVTLQHALTAAKCATENDGVPIVHINPAEYRVFAGSVLLTNDTSVERIRRIAKITIHPDYDPDTTLPANQRINDIAVIILGAPFSNNTVTPLSVIDIGFAERVTCILSGWGVQGSTSTVANTQLMFAQMQAIDQITCHFWVSPSVATTKLCAFAPGVIQGAAGCEGDIGGPLVCRDGLAGILIEASDCRTVPLRPQLFTRVSNYTSWIKSVKEQPIPELGPEPSTVAPTTLPTTPGTSPRPSKATTSKPVMAVLVVIVLAQIITANAIH
ncbi:hypothetical protein PYW07_001611 [Mythimna separata]|uniref:Peptidase S1 domain-containing protein n=1 Tax=Mythimna separata TaxID=271217 RepID=A0AAD7YVA9_MYTSE|nr:hypothetical protein PYW07_001611 [Mythimna separata]